MKPSILLLFIIGFTLITFSQSETTDFLIRNRGDREVIQLIGNKAVAHKLTRFETQYGRQWRMERITEVDTMVYNNHGVYEGTNGELRIKNEGFTFFYLPEGEKSKLKVRMKRDGYENPILLINSCYIDCKVDSLKEILMDVCPYFIEYNNYYYDRYPWEESMDIEYNDPRLFRSIFDSRFSFVADSLVELHTRKSAFTDSILHHLNTMLPSELDTTFQQLIEPSSEWWFNYCNEMVNGLAVENPANFCQWLEQTSLEKRMIYFYTDKRTRRSLKAFDTDSPVKKELLRNYRGNVALGTIVMTGALSFYGAIGVGIANWIALYR